MKKMIMTAALAAVMALAVPALAADQPAAAAETFGVVDMGKILQNSDAAKHIFSQLEERRKEYQGQISKEEDALRSAEQEIIKQKDTLSKEAFEAKRKQFEEKVVNGQKLVQDRKHILDLAFNNSMVRLRAEAAKIVADVAREKGYAAVFTQDAVMLSRPELDMTDVVIERMNKSLNKIPVEWPQPAAGDAPAAKGGKKK